MVDGRVGYGGNQRQSETGDQARHWKIMSFSKRRFQRLIYHPTTEDPYHPYSQGNLSLLDLVPSSREGGCLCQTGA